MYSSSSIVTTRHMLLDLRSTITVGHNFEQHNPSRIRSHSFTWKLKRGQSHAITVDFTSTEDLDVLFSKVRLSYVSYVQVTYSQVVSVQRGVQTNRENSNRQSRQRQF